MSAEKYLGNERKSLCILIGGKAGTGKDTVESYIADELGTKVNILEDRFAKAIKILAYKYFFWDGKKDAKGRRLLQEIGQCGRNYDIYLWAKHLFNWIERQLAYPYELVLISDWRFEEEFNYLKNEQPLYRPIKVLVSAPSRETLKGTDMYFDVSETSLPTEDSYYDFVIDNDGSIESTKLQVDELINYIKRYVGI